MLSSSMLSSRKTIARPTIRFSFIYMAALVFAVSGVIACAGEPAPEPMESTAPMAETNATTPAPAQTEPTEPEEGPEGVRNYTRVDATVACAGATPPEAMAELKERGFVSVINFRTAGENGATVDAGQEAAEAAGLTYFHIPFREPSAEVAETFLDTVSDPSNQPVFIHCGSANRVGAMWLIKRVKQDGWSVEEAMSEAEAIGLRSEGLKEFALEYVKDGA
jgi:uncharacterized protein (TIGR01244 family)